MSKTYELRINGNTLTDLKDYEVERNKLWSDADRNMAGELKATFVGVFPKITLEFNYMTEAQLKATLALLEPAVLSVQWWDSYSGSYKTANYYTGDYKTSYFDKEKGLYSPWKINLVPFKKYV